MMPDDTEPHGTEPGGHAAPLDAALGLRRGTDDGEWVVLHLDPAPVAVGATEPVPYLHGGALATAVDTAGWEAVVRQRPGSWVAADLRIDFVRLARPEPHVVRARTRQVGRTTAVADVEIAAAADESRLVALGRVRFIRTG